MNFIKLQLVHPSTKDHDAVAHIRADQVLEVHAAHSGDRKMRPELNAIVCTLGGRYAVVENVATVLEKLKEAEVT